MYKLPRARSAARSAKAAAPAFLYTTCQVGAEPALKSEMARLWPDFHFAYSRPGFVTFKLPDKANLVEDFDPRLVFARAHGLSLGKVRDERTDELARAVWQLVGDRAFDSLHVWQRDAAAPGYRGYHPGPTEMAAAAEQTLREVAAVEGRKLSAAPTKIGSQVLDCILVEPGEWWIGCHRAASPADCWPGGIPPIALPADAVSRAYLKMEEAILWSELPLAAGDRCVEIGCAPGGSSQALLRRRLSVVGIDPADVDPSVAANRHFTHVKKRGADVRRREFRGVRWLTADMNVAPAYTLDTVEAIVTHPTVNVRGLLLTLKLPEWKLAKEIPQYLKRVANWGYASVQARQLAHNRREICIAALKQGRTKSTRRRQRQSTPATKPTKRA